MYEVEIFPKNGKVDMAAISTALSAAGIEFNTEDAREDCILTSNVTDAVRVINKIGYLTDEDEELNEYDDQCPPNPSEKSQLVALARQIAAWRGYPDLVNGLQPVERLRTKYQAEIDEFKEALVKKSWLHQLHEAADVAYYAAALSEQTGKGLYVDALRECAQLIRFHGTRITTEQIEKAALAKYQYRASGPNNKDEALELRLIEEAVSR